MVGNIQHRCPRHPLAPACRSPQPPLVSVPDFPAPGPYLLRRADCTPGLFSPRVRHPPPLAQRAQLCRTGRAVPIPPRPGQQPGRYRVGPVPRGLPGRGGSLGRVHLAVGHRPDPVCPGAGPLRQRPAPWRAARPQGGRRSRGGPGRVGHGAQPVPRRFTGGVDVDRRLRGGAATLRLGSGRGHGGRRRGWPAVVQAREQCRARRPAHRHQPPRRSPVVDAVFVVAGGFATPRHMGAQPHTGAGGRLLPHRCAGIRRRPRGAAVAASRSGAQPMGQQ